MLLQLFTSIADELQSLSIVDLPKSDDVFNNDHIKMSDIEPQSTDDIIDQLRRENNDDDSNDDDHNGDDNLEWFLIDTTQLGYSSYCWSD